MTIAGYADYKSREFCGDVKCPVQMELNSKKPDSQEYAKIKKQCEKCRFTARQFHNWLTEKGYLLVRPEK